MDQQISHATELGLDIRPMTGYTGAEIFGVDLTKPLDPAVTAEIRAALLQWKVVFFRDQFIDREQHLQGSMGDTAVLHNCQHSCDSNTIISP